MNNFNVIKEDNILIKMWTKHVPLEDEAIKQLKNVASLPFIYKWIAAMPDVHVGEGATIGSVIPTKGAVIPAAVGYDKGCGIIATKTNLHVSDIPTKQHKEVRELIEDTVPHGFAFDGSIGSWKKIPKNVQSTWNNVFAKDYKQITDKHPGAEGKNTINHLGTLGSGNHFIEISTDENDCIWIVIHSG